MAVELTDIGHEAMWTALDDIAAQVGISVSALAMEAGLSSVTLNKSKRFLNDRRRWPSTESVAAILAVTGTSWAEFGQLVDQITQARLRQVLDAQRKAREVGGTTRAQGERASTGKLARSDCQMI